MRLPTRFRPAPYTGLRIIRFEERAAWKDRQGGFSRHCLGKCSVRRCHKSQVGLALRRACPKGAHELMSMDSYNCSCHNAVSNDNHNSTACPKKVGKKFRRIEGLARLDMLSTKTRNFGAPCMLVVLQIRNSPTPTKRLLLFYGCFKLEAPSLSIIEICY